MPKQDDAQAPATKNDLQELKREMKEMESRIDSKMDTKLEQLATRLTDHFNVVAENLVYDFKGIFKDRLEQHDTRITRLEENAGFAAE